MHGQYWQENTKKRDNMIDLDVDVRMFCDSEQWQALLNTIMHLLIP
jgi:hypothetical protein